MARIFITQDEVMRLIQDGWELGYFDGIRSDGMYQVQKGGATKGVRASTARALERKGLIEVVPRQPKQPFWCRHYRASGL